MISRRPSLSKRPSTPLSVHLRHNVAASNELPIDVELRYRRSIAKLFDRLAYLVVREHVARRKFHLKVVQDSAHMVRKSALGGFWDAFHEQHDPIFRNVLLYDVKRRLILNRLALRPKVGVGFRLVVGIVRRGGGGREGGRAPAQDTEQP